ncbi:hypothetical protein B7463_g10224, partial [Scytalidium lignicola]
MQRPGAKACGPQVAVGDSRLDEADPPRPLRLTLPTATLFRREATATSFIKLQGRIARVHIWRDPDLNPWLYLAKIANWGSDAISGTWIRAIPPFFNASIFPFLGSLATATTK